MTTQSWDTGEAELWIDNDQWLYSMISGVGLDGGQIRSVLTEFKHRAPAFDVDFDEVDFDYLADTFEEEDE